MRIPPKLMHVSLMLIATLTTASVSAANFGDEVVACAAAKRVQPNSLEASKVFAECEKEVSERRKKVESAKTDIPVLVDQFRDCLYESASDLDDSISPASEIARAAASSCRPKWMKVLVANSESISKMDSYPSQAVMDASIEAVLTQRKLRQRMKK